MTDSSQLLWEPAEDQISNAAMTRFRERATSTHGVALHDYPSLHKWSVEQPEAFWNLIWDFCNVTGERRGDVLRSESEMQDCRFFPESYLNFAENLLRFDDDQLAIVSRLENGRRKTLTYRELRHQVGAFAAFLSSKGVGEGDRVAAFMPNVAETIVGMLATTSVGAIWSSCSPDFGVNGVFDRFGQIEPVVLIACDGYFYNGKTIDSGPVVGEVCARVASIKHVVQVPYIGLPVLDVDATVVTWDEVTRSLQEPEFLRLPFNHPLYIMYSSGTTGVPKCIVHGAGGTLLQHLKEHQLHVNLNRSDTFFYFTTCGWMMWNWLVSGLASGSTLVLYDGSPFHPGDTSMMDMIDEEAITVFGTSAKYISALQKTSAVPKTSHKLTSLRTILSTGSPLSNESFRYVYDSVKSSVCLSSISGGTDIISCFTLGNPVLPVREGELQCLGLGMDVAFFDDDGETLGEGKGELVCRTPFPSMPIGFWRDEDGRKFHGAYFDRFPNTWAHGDYGELTSSGGVIIHGRSDAVLNPGGVRIGTAEIYRQVEKLPQVIDCLCIGQDWQDDVRVVLFVVLQSEIDLDEELTNTIKSTIRSETTPRHVPRFVIQVPDIPRTISGKIVELAVRNVVHGLPVKNTDALANPEALAFFRDQPLLQMD